MHSFTKHFEEIIMWETKLFKTKEAMATWVAKNDRTHQWQEIFVNNAFGIEYRKLRVIY
jgi:hypothetical protein